MKEIEHKFRVGRFIFFSNLALFGLLIVFYSMQGFRNDEFSEIIKLLAPIKAVYMTALIKYVIANKHEVINKQNEIKKVTKLYRSITSVMVVAHILSLIIAITAFALFNAMDFKALKNTIVFLEIFFGAYIGLIMSDMFGTDKETDKTNEN